MTPLTLVDWYIYPLSVLTRFFLSFFSFFGFFFHSSFICRLAALLIGVLSSLLGIGGGELMGPLMLHLKVGVWLGVCRGRVRCQYTTPPSTPTPLSPPSPLLSSSLSCLVVSLICEGVSDSVTCHHQHDVLPQHILLHSALHDIR